MPEAIPKSVSWRGERLLKIDDKHPDDDDLAAYAHGCIDAGRRNAIDSHVQTCAPCRTSLGEFVEVDQLLRDPLAWALIDDKQFDAPSSRETDATLDKIRALEERLANEDAAARATLPQLLEGEPAIWRERIARRPEVVSRSLVRQLLDQAEKTIEREPARALEFAIFADELCRNLPPENLGPDIVFELTGDAWRVKGMALRYLGRTQEALAALDRAAEVYEECLQPDVELARVDYVRATVFWVTGRFEEALALARKAAGVFRVYKDEERWFNSKILEASIVAEQGDWFDARCRYLDLLGQTDVQADLRKVARLGTNIATCNAELGDLESAASYFQLAISHYEELEDRTEMARTRWAMGEALVLGRKLRDGLTILDKADQELSSLGMRGEAATVALRRAEIHLAFGEANRAVELCRRAVGVFSEVEMEANTRAAAAYLREALDGGRASEKLVSHVRAFIEKAPGNPRLAFAPLPD